MAKRAIIGTVPSYLPGTTSASAINSNDTSLNAAFDNTLSRDGSTPNEMNADFDMNNNDILNVKNINATDIILSGTSIQGQVDAAAASATAAALSETNAATSATNAATSATAAAASAVTAEAAAKVYDLGFDFVGVPITDEVVGRWFVPRTVTLVANFAGSGGVIDTNPTATLALDVQDDGVTIGTVSISTGGVFTFTTVSGTEKIVATGSVVRLVAPTTPDATGAGILVTLKGTL